MGEDNIDKQILNIQNDFFEKCNTIETLLPKKQDKVKKSKDNITEAIKILLSTNQDLRCLLLINDINNVSNQGMHKLKHIYDNIIDKKNDEQLTRFYELLNELKKMYKLPTNTNEEIQNKYNIINDLINKIEAFQDEMSCKTLYKKY